MRYFSTFTGIGGFELAFPKNWECVGYSEIDKYAIQVYEKHFPQHKNYGDITTIKPSDLPDFDLFCGGFPCQAFSIAGKRRGFDDTRGTLFFDIARICEEKKPRYLLLENVKGLLSHDSGRTFQTILRVLSDIGYRVQWQVLNSKDHGVPQNRERVFIIGHLRGEPRPQVFPIRRTNNQTIKQMNKPTHSNNFVAMQWRRTEKGKEARRRSQQSGRDYTPFSGGHRELVAKQGKAVGTLTSQAIAKDSLVGNGIRVRRLTPVECERLQGFPDGWTDILSDTQRYKTLGNAVTVNVVKQIISTGAFIHEH